MKGAEKYKLFVVAKDHLNEEKLSHLVEGFVHEPVGVKTFNSKEAVLDTIDYTNAKPDVVVLDHKLNVTKRGERKFLHTMDQIKKMSPETHVIIFSEEKDMPHAVKALKYGAQDYVMKDQFLFNNIGASVAKCLEPSKL